MRRIGLFCVVASGCFYTDPINQRPSLDIDLLTSPTPFRGDTVKLKAVASDPEEQAVYFHWRAYMCTDKDDCDPAPKYDPSLETFEFEIPATRADGITPVQAVHVYLEGKDDYGAVARPVQELVLGVLDRGPGVKLRPDSRYGYVKSTPINVYAEISDADDDPHDASITWEVYPPVNNPGYDFVDVQVQPSSTVQYGKQFTPHDIGDWTIVVTATDPTGNVTIEPITIHVQNDQPPWLTQLSPIVAPSGSALPMSEPTLFQVTIVTDDLDPYPTSPDPVLGTTKFTWSLLAPGASTRQVLSGVTGNHVALDPASYAPGAILELRVEIYDRNLTPITCSDSMASCSVIADPQRLQRQTWRVEVR